MKYTNQNPQEKVTPMLQSVSPRLPVFFLLSAILLSVLPGCTKRIDTSNEDKYYKTLTEVMNSLPASKQKEFDEGMTMIWFYSESDEETNALIQGKTGTEILALVEEMKASLPKLDTSSKEAFEESLAKIRDSLPSSKIGDYNAWVKELPAYRQGNQKLDALNGKTFQKIIENRDFVNGQNHGIPTD